jgi:hypothetical protein
VAGYSGGTGSPALVRRGANRRATCTRAIAGPAPIPSTWVNNATGVPQPVSQPIPRASVRSGCVTVLL